MASVNFWFINNQNPILAEKIKNEINLILSQDAVFSKQNWILDYEYQGENKAGMNLPPLEALNNSDQIRVGKIIDEVRQKYIK